MSRTIPFVPIIATTTLAVATVSLVLSKKTATNGNDYSRFNNPNTFLSEKVISFIAMKILRLDNTVTRNRVEVRRNWSARCEEIFHSVACHVYNCSIIARSYRNRSRMNRDNGSENCDDNGGISSLVGGTVHVSRNSNVLHDWGITRDGESHNTIHTGSENYDGDDGHVNIEMTCPSSAILWEQIGHLKTDEEQEGSNTKSSVTSPRSTHTTTKVYNRVLNGANLKDLPLSPTAPILIWFHGGGMVSGTPRDAGCSVMIAKWIMDIEADAKEKRRLMKKNLVDSKVDANVNANEYNEQDYEPLPLILLSVEYRLSLEHPFPAAVIDCLSAVEAILDIGISSDDDDTQHKHPIHVAGHSAGGNLACVVAFECLRRFPQKKVLKSAVIIDPFLLPRGNTSSYYSNSKTAVFDISFIRWCWRVYLGFDHLHKNIEVMEEATPSTTTTTTTTTAKEDGYQWWPKGQKYDGLLRLCCPQVDPPSIVNTSNVEEAPRFIVHTGAGDPLRNDGLELLKSLRAVGRGKLATTTTTVAVGQCNYPKNVMHFEGTGGHGGAFIFDCVTRRKLLIAWHEAIYGGT